RIRIAPLNHDGGEDVAVVAHEPVAVAIEIAVALLLLVKEVRIFRHLLGAARIADVEPGRRVEPDLRHRLADLLFPADKDRMAEARIAEGERRADHAFFLAFGEDDALRV